MPKTELPAIEEIKLSSLEIDYTLAGRSEKEVKANAKELAPMLAAGWSPSQPGEYFERGGKKHLAAGFTRTAAAIMNDHKVGYFVRVPDIASELRTTAIRTNASKPISPFEQGRIYAAMRDGTKAEDSQVGEEVLTPMKEAEIAKVVGKKPQWINACIGIFESPEELHPFIENGQVSANVIKRASELVKHDEKKLIRAVKMIVKHAEGQGRCPATMKDLEACRPDFAPFKAATKPAPDKLISDNGKTSDRADSSAQDAIDRENNQGQPSGEPDGESEASGEVREVGAHEIQSDVKGASDAQPELFEPDANKPSKKASKNTIEALTADFRKIAEEWSEECAVSFTPPDLDALLEKLTDYVTKANVPF